MLKYLLILILSGTVIACNESNTKIKPEHATQEKVSANSSTQEASIPKTDMATLTSGTTASNTQPKSIPKDELSSMHNSDLRFSKEQIIIQTWLDQTIRENKFKVIRIDSDDNGKNRKSEHIHNNNRGASFTLILILPGNDDLNAILMSISRKDDKNFFPDFRERLLFKLCHTMSCPYQHVCVLITNDNGRFSFCGEKTAKLVKKPQLREPGEKENAKRKKVRCHHLSRARTFKRNKVYAQNYGKYIEQFIRNYPDFRDAKCEIITREPGYIEISLTKINGKVIENHKYWENLDLSIVLSGDADNPTIRIIADGSYGAGFKPPDDFKDMDPVYYKDLDKYTQILLTKLVEFLEGGAPK
jgi:hypothetical protein